MGLPHFKVWILRMALLTTDNCYDCRLIIWYLLIGIILIVANFSAYDHYFTTLPIHSCMVELEEDGD